MPPETNTPNKTANNEVIPELIEEARHRLDGVNNSIRVIEHKTYALMLVNFAVLGILWETEKSHFLFFILVPLIAALVCFFMGLFNMRFGGIPGAEPISWKGKTNKKYRERIYAGLFNDYQEAIERSVKKHEAKKRWYQAGYILSGLVFLFVCLKISFDIYPVCWHILAEHMPRLG